MLFRSIFGPPTSFQATCAALDLDILASIPIEPLVSARGDKGWPVAVGGSGDAEVRADGAAAAFVSLGNEVWTRLVKLG